MKIIRIGITGSGFMGRTHADAAHKLDSTQLVAIAGGSRAAQLAEDYGAECESDVESLLTRDDIDAIVIATPHYCHCDEVLTAAASGKHVLVEKPLSTSLDNCDRMIAACREKNLVMSVGYHQRFRESNKKTHELIQSGAIGKVHCIQTSALFDIASMRSEGGYGGKWDWWKDPRSIAHLINGGPHTVDLCRWWLGAEVTSVSAQCGTFREENPNENTTMSLLGFTDGTMCTYWSSSVLPDPGFPDESFRFRIMGDQGLIDLNPYGELRLAREGKWETVYQQPPVEFEKSDSAFDMSRMQAYCDQLQAFVNSIHGTAGGEGTHEDGRAGVATVLAMLESSATGKTINLCDGGTI